MNTLLLIILLLILNFSVSDNILDENSNKVYGINVKVPYKNDLLLEYVYQIPTSKRVKGLLFLAHGCSHSGTDWFDKDDNCQNCIGLPIEKTIVIKALKNDYGVLAMTSTNRRHKCWSHVDIEPSSFVLKDFFNKLYSSNILVKDAMVPIHLLGASSGGSYVGMMAMNMSRFGFKISSICVQIMALMRIDSPNSKLHLHIPPTIFVHMIRDQHIAIMIHDSIVKLQHENIPVQEYQCKSKAITKTFFNDHGKVLSLEDSNKLYTSLLENGYIDKNTFELIDDPRLSNWRDVVKNTLPNNEDTLIADFSPLSELFNVAYGQHEITDEYLNETFEFFKKYS